MKIVNLNENARIAIMRDMLIEVSRATTQYEVMEALGNRFWKLRPVDYMVSISRRGLADGEYKVTRRVRRTLGPDGPRPENVGPTDPWHTWNSIPVSTGGFIGALIADPQPKLIHELRVRDDPVLGDTIAEMGSCMAVPLYDRGEPIYWTFSFRREDRGYTPDDLEQNMLSGNLIGGTNRQLVLVQEVRRLNSAIMAQFEEIARVQRSLLPATEPQIPGVQIKTSYLTSQQAGGDYFDFFPLPDGRWGLLIADVSGHGAAAATVMAMLHAIIRGYSGPAFGPHEVLPYINRRLMESGLTGTFVTAFLATLEPDRARMTVCRAGHPPPLLKHGDGGEVSQIEAVGALPLGVVEPYECEPATVQLRRDDTVVMYTDGITEAFDGARRMFGVEGVRDALRACSGAPDCVVDSVQGALHRHTGRLDRDDDQTLVVVRYAGDTR